MWHLFLMVIGLVAMSGCTVKAVGDPNRPITINAHITLDIKGLKDTASDIEDYVSSGKSVVKK
jgi:hypothetical protein